MSLFLKKRRRGNRGFSCARRGNETNTINERGGCLEPFREDANLQLNYNASNASLIDIFGPHGYISAILETCKDIFDTIYNTKGEFINIPFVKISV